MSVFDEIMCKLNEISNRYVSSLNDDIKVAFDCLDKFAEEYQNGREKRETTQKNNKNLMNTLQSINEDEDESSPKDAGKPKDGEKRLSSKRGKQEVEGMSSPEQEKRQKRNASVKAQNNITKQNLRALRILNRNIILITDEEDGLVNVNLTQKLRREDSVTKPTRRRKEDDKENSEPVVQVKQEKISLPPEPMEIEAALDIEVKQEPNKDDFAMPPPAAPVPKPRKMLPKDKSTDSEEEQPGRRTRTRKQTDSAPPPAADKLTDSEDEGSARRPRTRKQADAAPPADRATRASRRNTRQAEPAGSPPEPRPKRTRAKKKASETSTTETENAPPQETGSPAEKPRPKRTRRGKAAEKEAQKPKEPEPEIITPKEERVSLNPQSPAIPMKATKKKNEDAASDDSEKSRSKKKEVNLEETHVLCPLDATVTLSMDKTVVLTNGVYDHTDGNNKIMNSTVVLEKMNRETLILDKPAPMDATVVIEKDSVQKEGTPNITDDMSILTDDNSEDFATPPKDTAPEPTSAVKAKVQQFEEMAARTTRTKTRAMAKKDAVAEDNCTPPDKISKQVLSADTLAKMNSMIFNGKTSQISASASKPTAKLPARPAPASASKAAAGRARDEPDARGRDDARRKKEAMLEAKKEMQRRKREEKMAAAAAAREAAEKERRAAMQAAARDRLEKQLHADQGKIERMKEVEKKKQELARKVAETEERRRAEEAARHARLADEQRRADAARRKQLEDSEAMKKEAALMAKEIEKRQKEYLEKQKMKQRMEADKMHTPLKTGTPCGKGPAMEPAYMSDGFQYLNSDEDEDEPPKLPTPPWCASKARHRQLALQHLLPVSLVDRLFSVRVHSPDLRGIFPALERRDLKRTSSAVWRTPPALQLPRIQESPV